MATDRELLQRYVRDGAEDALEEVVRRHIDLVYSTALRQLCGNAALAEDVTQAVFATMANKAETLAAAGRLTGWLYAATRATVQHAQRAGRRPPKSSAVVKTRAAEEAGANVPEVPADAVDGALASLGDDEREAVLQRVFEDQSFFAIGTALGSNEEAARAAATRGLEKVRTFLLGRGVSLTAANVPLALERHLLAAPAPLAGQVTAATFAAAGAAAGAGTKAGARAFFGSAMGVAGLAGAAAIVLVGLWIHERRVTARLQQELAQTVLERDQLRAELEEDSARFSSLAQQATTTNQRLTRLQQRVDELAKAGERPPRADPVVATPPPKPSPAAAAEAHKRRADRLAQWKPQLAAGLPIKGAAVVMSDGKPKSAPVEFMIGKETKIEADEGQYGVNPRLLDDGSVEYTVTLRKRGPDGSLALLPEQSATVVQVPWQGFIMEGDNGNALAFDPDEGTP